MILIPAYNPDNTLFSLISNLYESKKDLDIVVVKDGCSLEKSEQVFKDLKKTYPLLKLIELPKNQGKGVALKKGILFALKNHKKFIVTADADGQHTVKDILHFYQLGQNNSDRFIVGNRCFEGKIPLRSKVGNVFTKKLMSIIFGTKLQDTQSGLRLLPNNSFEDLLTLKGRRYEYELQMLIYFIKNKRLEYVDIETVYEEGNPSSHFNKILDSTLIYGVIFKAIFSSIIAALIDIISFGIIIKITENHLISVLLARVISTIVYFILYKNFVFRKQKGNYRTILKFIFLVSANILFVTFILDQFIKTPGDNKSVIYYAFISIIMFFVNFYINKKWVFKE